MLESHQILLAVPTPQELDALKKHVRGYGIAETVCGAGPACPAMRLSLLLARQKFDAVMLAGIAGGYRGKTGITDVVCAGSETYGDLGRCTDSGITPARINEDDMPLSFPLPDILRHISAETMKKAGIRYGPMITVSCVSGSETRLSHIAERFPDAMCENMEGASVAMVCRHFDIPMFEIRGISNMAGDTDMSNWEIREALDATGRQLSFMLKAITGKNNARTKC